MMDPIHYDLETTYLFLDGAGGVTPAVGGAGFWASLNDHPAAGDTLITVGTGEGDWPQWEMHPNGDEVLILLQGALTLVLEHPDGRLEHRDLAAGATCIVPAGVWHRAMAQRAVRMLFITYGPGTTHRPVA